MTRRGTPHTAQAKKKISEWRRGKQFHHLRKYTDKVVEDWVARWQGGESYADIAMLEDKHINTIRRGILRYLKEH